MADSPIYRIYIDDSGEKEYGEKTSRYFVYAGCLVPKEAEEAIDADLDELKRKTFGTTDVEVKSNWIRRPRERRKHYLDPYGVEEETFHKFVDAWLEQMQRPEVTYVASAIDKIQMQEKYAQPHYASATAYHFLLQRYQIHCAKSERTGQVTIDDMSGATPKANHWRDLLRRQHTLLKEHGCQFTDLKFANIALRFRFGQSERFNLLQVADLVAYDVYRQFRDHGDTWDDAEADSVPIYKGLRPILPRFMRSPTGQLEGWGIVKWPSQREGRWGLTERAK